MRVIYSIDARLGATGIGYTAFNAVQGIYAAGALARLYVSANAQSIIPTALIRQWGTAGRVLKYLAAHDSTGILYHLENILFDTWVAVQLPMGDLLHTWNGHALQSLRRAKQRGMITVIERASSHPATMVELLREEHRRWQVLFHLPMWNYTRLLREIAEADYITTPSAFARDSMMAHGVSENKLIRIPFGVDSQYFTPARTQTAHPFRALFAGQVSIRKGIPYLLEAWQRLGWLDAELWIAGNVTRDFAAIRERWRDLPGITFLGHARDVLSLYQQSDVFVFPSIEEGSALVTYEAMACGLPIITTPNAGSVARDSEEGYIVPIRNVEALCAALERLRADAPLRERMARAARARAEEFPWARYCDALLASYRKMLER
jgi:glycosyltransferase involved in cell wall biosynthesis